MSSFVGKFAWVAAGMMLVALVAAQGQSSPPRRTRPILFSDPKRDSGTSNLNQVATKRMTLQSLEDDLKKPFDVFDMADPTRREANFSPLPRAESPRVANKQLKSILEKDKDWVFKSPEDYASELGLTAEEIFKVPQYGPDGKLKKKATPLENYYERQERARAGATNQIGNSDFINPQKKDGGFEDWPRPGPEKQPGVASQGEQTLNRFSVTGNGSTPGADPGKSRSIADVFGLGNSETPATLRAQELRLEEYKKILDPRAVSPVDLFGGAPGTASGGVMPKMVNPLPGTTPPRDSFSTYPSVVGVPLQPQGLAGTPARLPGLTTLPPLEKPVVTTPSSYAPPRRKF